MSKELIPITENDRLPQGYLKDEAKERIMEYIYESALKTGEVNISKIAKEAQISFFTTKELVKELNTRIRESLADFDWFQIAYLMDKIKDVKLNPLNYGIKTPLDEMRVMTGIFDRLNSITNPDKVSPKALFNFNLFSQSNLKAKTKKVINQKYGEEQKTEDSSELYDVRDEAGDEGFSESEG